MYVTHCSCTPNFGLNVTSNTIVPQVQVGKGSHPHKVKVFGPGVERTGLKAHEPTHFTVDCTEAGEGNKDIHVHMEFYALF